MCLSQSLGQAKCAGSVRGGSIGHRGVYLRSWAKWGVAIRQGDKASHTAWPILASVVTATAATLGVLGQLSESFHGTNFRINSYLEEGLEQTWDGTVPRKTWGACVQVLG